jgi:hypothetical protein
VRHWLRMAPCLLFLGSLFVLPPGSLAFPQKIVMGRLTKIGNSAIYLDQNGRSLTLLISSTTELWSRGTDV